MHKSAVSVHICSLKSHIALHIPVTSLVVASAWNEVLKGWGLLCILAGGVTTLHIAKLALEGPGLNQLLYMPPQNLPEKILTVSDGISICLKRS